MTCRIGIDAGSKTIKIVVLDERGAVERSVYRRHRADIKTTLSEVVHDLVWRHGDVSGSVAVTGSAGIELAEALGVPFVQEVVATTHAARADYPEADAIIELGGEDAKIVYLTGGLEQRMNATCAGGTGGFIDTIAFMLGVSTKEMSNLAMGATRSYPIASRCAVFAQTDVRPLLNAGAKKSDIAASALDAVVKQTLGGLACGRPIEGTTIFLGGPLEHIPSLVHRFRRALDLDHKTGIKPNDAHLFTARGAALLSDDPARLGSPIVHMSLSELEKGIGEAEGTQGDLPRLPPLFSNQGDVEAFNARHASERIARKRLGDAQGAIYLGIDAGSTAVKLVLVDGDGCLLHSDYRPVAGNVLAASSEMLLDMYRALPREYDGTPLCTISHATVTGYGENLLMAAFGIDSGVVETTAHLRAARSLHPDVDFVLDIGGQDMKALWIERGSIRRAVLNEACSSGCGSFIEGSAHSLRCTPHAFAKRALKSAAPVDLGTKCTVFMTSRVRHAQKIGASYDDIAAGISYSVVNNALFKVIGLDNLDSLGNTVVVQGGAFLSDAVLRAFELVSGRHAIRPDIAHLMGAYGAALVARSRARAAEASQPERAAGSHAPHIESSLLEQAGIAALKPRYRTETCPGCTNECSLSIVTFESEPESGKGFSRRPAKDQSAGRETGGRPARERRFIDGNRCERAYSFFENSQGRTGGLSASAKKAPNTVALEQGLLARYGDSRQNESREKGKASSCADIVVGLPCTLNDYESLPFWHTLLTRLGFSVLVGRSDDAGAKGFDTIPSESACYPAKTTHQRIFSLLERGACAIFMPKYERSSHCPVSSLYASAILDSVPPLRDGTAAFASPKLSSMKPDRIASDEGDRTAILDSLRSLSPDGDLPSKEEFDQAIGRAKSEQEAFYETLERACRRALDWIEKTHGHGIVLAGRPYHADPAISHGIDGVLSSMGFAVLAPEGLGRLARRKSLRAALETPPAVASESAASDGFAAEATDESAAFEAKWRQGKRLDRLSAFVASHDDLDMVCLQSFGCAYDAVSLIDVKKDLEAAGRSFTALKIDEISDTAHIRIRLRTLADSIEERRDALQEEAAGPSPLQSACDRSRNAGESEVAGDSSARTKTVELGGIEPEDIEIGRREVSQDVCSTVAAVAGRIIRICRADPSIDTVIVPEGCTACLFDALPDLVKDPLGFAVRILMRRAGGPSWKHEGTKPSDPHSGCPPQKEPRTRTVRSGKQGFAPRIGIIGNPFMVFESPLNEGLADFVESLGCEAILPDPDKLLVDDVRYLDQMAAFEAAGVDHVIYAQSFGCLKGHVESRGALHGLRKRFARMPVTVIDYDPDASALNRRNRILLVAESVRNAHASDV